jgi:rubrerythrin
MNDQNKDLINMCHDLYALEKEAHDTYELYLKDLEDSHEREVIDSIHLDEEHHMKIAQEMLKIAENNNEN